MGIEILGIRHHGVGSAIRIQKRLEELKPDLIFIEGPPEIETLLKYIGVTELKPPVSIMIYNQDNPNLSNFYPYAVFSPEWVAAVYANEYKIPIRALDLPASNSLDTNFQGKLKDANSKKSKNIQYDPIGQLARISGFEKSEEWWEYMFEKTDSKENSSDHFLAVNMAMQALRENGVMSSLDAENEYREAYMRKLIRTAKSEMYANIAVICGAWHGPSLYNLEEKEKTDNKLLKTLPKSKVKLSASWIPWTNGRLSMHSGYGAGISSPGWYEHLWENRSETTISWLTRVGALFREKGKDISSAHVLESYKLARALCQLRQKSHVTINELNESILTVMCMGDAILLELIKKKLIVNDKIGHVPDDIPKVPLQADFESTIKSLRLKLSAAPKDQVLDLRKKIDLNRSRLFFRLRILDVQWAKIKASRSKGTFKEIWILVWDPNMMVDLVEKSFLGNTILAACEQTIRKTCTSESKTKVLSALLKNLIPADLDHALDHVLNRIDELTTISSDIQDIMSALPTLINISRYGDVRKSDVEVIENIVNRLLTKVCLSLKNACYGLDEENANLMFHLVSDLHGSIKLHNNTEILDLWFLKLKTLMNKDGIHMVLQGCASRLLLDESIINHEEAATLMSYSLSFNVDPFDAASWIEGFLRGSGMILIYDQKLWNLMYKWVAELDLESFQKLLPYLRRAFSKFEDGEKKQLGIKAKQGLQVDNKPHESEKIGQWNEDQATEVFETIKMLMGDQKSNI